MAYGDGWVETLITQQGDGTALTNSTTATSILNAQAKFTLAPHQLNLIGKELLVEASGRISTVVTTPGTLTLDVRFGSVIVATSQAFTLSTTAKTNVTWRLRWNLTLRAVGASTTANVMHTGDFTSEALGATTTAGEAKTATIPASAPAVGTGFDSTATQVVDLFATWSVASASNSIQTHQYRLIRLT